MNKLNEEALRSLKQLREINTVRAKGYQKAVDMTKNGSSKKYFEVKINESKSLSEFIDRSLEIVNEPESNLRKLEEDKLHQSQFYYTMAASSTNPRTVAVSCQLGDKFAEKAYASALSVLQLLSWPEVKSVLDVHVSNLRKSFESTQEAFDLAFIY
ncbi:MULTISPECIES: hypothetical protein [Emticicia]|uniref:hypothetical protein n=1 Tax=Emticicia TaxID=312278 RepID=UPI0020A20B3D|nr:MULTISPECIES: hypothetical protein [Emticicia]UTA70177.1 hypothetical protein MB380_10220 [Emticicia sp. 21SJ11W-3]